MSGSSRSLLRALQTVFDHWQPNWHDPPQQISDLYSTIYSYIERHNTLAAASSHIHDDLHAVYVHHIRSSADLSKETFFLEVLTRLSPMLSSSSVQLWLQTYLRPAVDSAGFDLGFVSRARAFVSAVAIDLLPSDDPALNRRREAISAMAMDHILRLYLGDPKAYAFCGLAVSDQNSQLVAERLRFVERNAGQLLRQWGLKHPRAFADAADRYFQSAAYRHKVLLLVSMLLSSTVASTQAVFDSPFFASLLRSLCLDRSESILGSALGALLMLVGKVCHRISGHLPVLLVIYSRLLCWQPPKKTEAKTEEKSDNLEFPDNSKSDTFASWDLAGVDPNASIMKTQIYSDGSFNLSYYLTLVYALFPSNVMAFARAPHDFLQSRSPGTPMAPEIAHVVSQLSEQDHKFISQTTTDSVKHFLLHPNFVNQVSLADELSNPISWILQKNEGQDMNEEEVMIECFSLNPQILFAISDDASLPEHFLKSIRSSRVSLDLGAGSSNLKGALSTPKRTSLQQSDISYTNSPNAYLPSYLQNMDRRVSIVPTRLVLENEVGDESKEVTFKQFSFDGSSFNSDSTLREPPEKKPDQLSDLYSVHEKLFTSSGPANNSAMLNTEVAQSTSGKVNGANTATDMLAKQLKSEGTENPKETPASYSGTALDFYQRELLLMKNELEFSSYMKHLNKMNYVKLKLRFNKLLKEQSQQPDTAAVKKTKAVQTPEYVELMASFKSFSAKLESDAAAKSEENVRLFEKVQELQSSIHQLEGSLAETTTKLADSERLTAKLDEEVKARTKEVFQLQADLQQEREKQTSQLPTSQPESESIPQKSPFLSNQELEISNLQTSLQIAKDAKNKVSAELEGTKEELQLIHKAQENQLAAKKLELSEALREQSASYERKIKELTGLMAKYEMSLEKEMSRNVQLSKAKPIRIPEMRTQQPATRPWTSPMAKKPEPERDNYFRSGGYDYFTARENSSGSENQSLSPPPSTGGPTSKPLTPQALTASRQGSMTAIPIIKGRGGYQKRSKKAM